MDDEYVMMRIVNGEPGHPGNRSERRAQAMRQWVMARADQEFTQARIRTMGSMVNAAAWHHCHAALSVLPTHFVVSAGESICHETQGLHASSAVSEADAGGGCIDGDDPLLRGLLHLDVSGLLHALQPFDPLSWRCQRRALQHQWFVRHQEEWGLTGAGVPPHARMLPAAPAVSAKPPPPPLSVHAPSCMPRPARPERGRPPFVGDDTHSRDRCWASSAVWGRSARSVGNAVDSDNDKLVVLRYVKHSNDTDVADNDKGHRQSSQRGSTANATETAMVTIRERRPHRERASSAIVVERFQV